MQPTLCSRCKKNVAVIFITRIENGESHNEGLCLRCARELHIKPVDEMMEKLGISDADLDNLTGDVAEMLGSMGMLGGDGAADADADASDADTDEDDGKTATFPFLNRLFNQNPPPAQDAAAAASEPVPAEAPQPPASVALDAPLALAPSAPASEAAVAATLLGLSASGESWVTVHDARGKQLINRALTAGETVALDGDAPLSVTIGRKDVVQATVRGEPFDLKRLGSSTVARFQVK